MRCFRKNIFLQKTTNMGSDNEKKQVTKPVTNRQKEYEVTSQGSLGLLAMGAAGIRAWRKKREEEKLNTKPSAENE
jgi:hypothetical protein